MPPVSNVTPLPTSAAGLGAFGAAVTCSTMERRLVRREHLCDTEQRAHAERAHLRLSSAPRVTPACSPPRASMPARRRIGQVCRCSAAGCRVRAAGARRRRSPQRRRWCAVAARRRPGSDRRNSGVQASCAASVAVRQRDGLCVARLHRRCCSGRRPCPGRRVRSDTKRRYLQRAAEHPRGVAFTREAQRRISSVSPRPTTSTPWRGDVREAEQQLRRAGFRREVVRFDEARQRTAAARAVSMQAAALLDGVLEQADDECRAGRRLGKWVMQAESQGHVSKVSLGKKDRRPLGAVAVLGYN